MKKSIIFAAVAALTVGLSQVGHAQTAATNSGATSTAGAGAIAGGGVGIGTLVLPGTNVAAPNVGGVQTVWTMGQTTGGNSVTSYDACLKNAQLTVLFAAVAVPLEISHCWELRDMDAMAKFPPGSIQYEHGCRDSSWLNTDWVSGTMACTANKAKLAKSQPNDPRARSVVAVPVVSTNMGNPVPNGPSPTVVPVAATNQSMASSVDYSRLCNPRAGIVEQCTQR